MKFLFLFLFPVLGLAQQPSHYLLGEEELEGIDIYGIHHGSDLTYYLATSAGLVIYDGYDFIPFKSPEMLMTSVFNLVEDYQGRIYCHNLSGQIFKFEGKRLELFYTVPDSLLSADLSIEVDDRNQLMIRAAKMMFLDSEGNNTSDFSIGYMSYPLRCTDRTISVYSRRLKTFVAISNGNLDYTDKVDVSDSLRVFNPIDFQNNRYLFESRNGKVFQLDEGQLKEKINLEESTSVQQSYRAYSTSNSLWLAPNSSGLYQFDEELNLINENPYFSRKVISFIEEDREGNLLLGTLGEGLIVVPNERIRDIQLPSGETPVSLSRSGDKLYLGTLSGKVLSYGNEQFSVLRNGQGKRTEFLHAFENGQILTDQDYGVLFNPISGGEVVLDIGSIKDASAFNSDTILVASNVGCFWVNRNTGANQRIDKLAQRYYCVGYDSSMQSIYSGTSKGFSIRKRDGYVSDIQLEGKTIAPRDFVFHRGRMYVATREHGLLICENDSVVERWSEGKQLISNNIRRVKLNRDTIIFATENGVQLLGLDGTSIRSVRESDGLITEKIKDVEWVENGLWVLHRKGIQHVNLDYLDSHTYTPSVSIHNLLVNDSTQDLSTTGRFQSDQRNVSFELKVNNLRFQDEISYQYTLEGADKSWQSNRYQDNLIQYRSLSPGNYTFKSRAVFRGLVSSEESYSFSIATPFYMAWWFYALISIGLILLLLLWFRRRLKRQVFLAQQQNELNASKLTAIQSQMNPHFIFNALNSIQDLVLKGDVSNSYTYITKFADLVRRTLNYSDKDFIDFESELKLIELYLTLEKLRFKTNFEFTIDADGAEDIQLPPMLIQPFIENALVHGLLHREGDKKLDLKFELEENLICIITDNGVGREKAKEIKERQRSTHESFSVNAIKRRFEILQRNFGGELGFTIEDLTENGIAIGTRVKLTIPVKRKF